MACACDAPLVALPQGDAFRCDACGDVLDGVLERDGDLIPTLEAVAAHLYPPISAPQRAVCRLIQGLPPPEGGEPCRTSARGDMEWLSWDAIYERLIGRAWGEDLRTPRSTIVIACGVRSGKSMIASWKSTYDAETCSLAGLLPGEDVYIPVIAPRMENAEVILGYVKGYAAEVPDLAADTDDPKALSVRFSRGARISLHAANKAGLSVRSRWLAGLILDEAAYFRSESGAAVTDAAIVSAAGPRMRRGAQILGVSSPAMRSGWLFDTYETEWGRCVGALVIRAPTYFLNPSYDIPDAIQPGTPQWDREIEALFVEDGDDAGCTRAQVEACMEGRTGDLPPKPGLDYADAIDLSGEGRDRTAYAIGHQPYEDSFVVDAVRSWTSETPEEVRFADIARLRRRYGIRGALRGDQFSAGVAAALARTRGFAMEKDTGYRPAQHAQLKAALRDKRVSLPPDSTDPRQPQLRQQFPAIVVRQQQGGGRTVDVPRDPQGGHCDEAVAITLLCDVLAQAVTRYTTIPGKRILPARPAPPAAPVQWEGLGMAAFGPGARSR